MCRSILFGRSSCAVGVSEEWVQKDVDRVVSVGDGWWCQESFRGRKLTLIPSKLGTHQRALGVVVWETQCQRVQDQRTMHY